MKPAICSSSLRHLSLSQLIDEAATLDVAVELACEGRHLTRDRAVREATQLAADFADMGVTIAALKLPVELTAEGPRHVEEALDFIDACRVFDAKVLKLRPGGPSSSAADDEHYGNLASALERLAVHAEGRGVKLALEIGPGMITDTLTAVDLILEYLPADIVGVSIDLCDLTLACREDPMLSLEELAPRTLFVTAKDGEAPGDWTPIGQGRVDWPRCLTTLSLQGYTGYVSVDCPDIDPRDALPAVAQDLASLRKLLTQLHESA